MIYDILVTIKNSPNKVTGWGYLIKADTKQEAIDRAMGYAIAKVNKPYSRFKKCTLVIEDKNVIEKPDW